MCGRRQTVQGHPAAQSLLGDLGAQAADGDTSPSNPARADPADAPRWAIRLGTPLRQNAAETPGRRRRG